MFSKRYDLIIVTGCSLSSGMEMIDHLLPKFNTAKERGHSITRWYKNNFDTTGKVLSIEEKPEAPTQVVKNGNIKRSRKAVGQHNYDSKLVFQWSI